LSGPAGGFCDSIAAGIRQGREPHGRALDICAEIYAKAHGRRGSKAYEAAIEEFYAKVGEEAAKWPKPNSSLNCVLITWNPIALSSMVKSFQKAGLGSTHSSVSSVTNASFTLVIATETSWSWPGATKSCGFGLTKTNVVGIWTPWVSASLANGKLGKNAGSTREKNNRNYWSLLNEASRISRDGHRLVLSCALLNAHAGNHYIYDQNGRVLGYTSGRYLYSETGQELGFFDGKYLYDPEGREIGYRSGRYLYSQKTGQVLGYLQGDENCDGD
jgi:hypothetical protein